MFLHVSDSKPAGVSTTSRTLSLVYVCFDLLLDQYECKDDETVWLCSLFSSFCFSVAAKNDSFYPEDLSFKTVMWPQ